MTSLLTLILACGTQPDAHEHGDHAGHDEGAAAAQETKVGDHTLRLHPGEAQLRLEVLGADGKPVAATGDARVVLTGTGQAPQRVVLKPQGSAWSAPAEAAGAPGYLAIVNMVIDGKAQTARLSWGEVPEAATPAPPDHDHGEGDHDHEHGDDGHTH